MLSNCYLLGILTFTNLKRVSNVIISDKHRDQKIEYIVTTFNTLSAIFDIIASIDFLMKGLV